MADAKSTTTDKTDKTDKTDSKAAAEKDDKATAKQVQEAVDVETDQGFRGIEVDQTPNEHYTLAGVNAGKPTPETDEKAAREVAEKRFEDSLKRD